MVMDQNKYRSISYLSDQDEPQSWSENRHDSPVSGDDFGATGTAPSPKKSRRSIKKKVVQVAIGDVDGSRSKGEAYPPSDSWAWRKYGQKPIKGSPYPRGYYRCSSSKGCPARKQVERNREDPRMLIITYACEHNHPLPIAKHQHQHNQNQNQNQQQQQQQVVAATPPVDNVVASPTTTTTSVDAEVEVDVPNDIFGEPPQLEFFVGDSFMLGSLGMEYSWISDMSFSCTPSLVGPSYDDVDMFTNFPMREEDKSLFGDLDELPECSLVFQRNQPNIDTCTTTTTAPLCGGTG